jgi:hypothetical protein
MGLNGEHRDSTGSGMSEESVTDVVITIFSEKIGAFLKNQCYDHNFLRFFQIFSEKIGAFLKNQCYDHNFLRFFQIFSEKIGAFLKNQC